MKGKRVLGWTAIVAAVLLCIGGCEFGGSGFFPRAKSERTVELQRALEAGMTLAVSTASGSIDVKGMAVDEARVVATITAYAPTEEEAQEIAEQVEIGFEPSGRRVTVKADRPKLTGRRSVSISYDIVVPEQTSLDCGSASGSIEIVGLQGDVKADAASGSVRAERIRGSVRLHSASGSVRCRDVQGGDVRLHTASGSVRLAEASGIGVCEVHSSSGSTGASGVQAASIKIGSASGSVDLDDARAQEIDMNAASGRVEGKEIDCSRLKAESASGSVLVAFARTAPADLTADLRAVSGSVTVVPPPEFAGRIDLATTSGSIQSALPVLVQGRIDKKHIVGTVGEGTGSLTARSTSGSVTIR